MTNLVHGVDRVRDLASAYRHHVRAAGNEPRLLASVAFLVTFIAIRLVTHAIHAGIGPFVNLAPGGVHVHHMVLGLVLVLGAGLLDLAQVLPNARALVFGAGAALVLDEFALILNLADVYWGALGRESIDAVLIFGAALSVISFGGGLWRALYRIAAGRTWREAA